MIQAEIENSLNNIEPESYMIEGNNNQGHNIYNTYHQ